MTVAALFVEEAGVYANRDGVDPWSRRRDARCYPGPHPVVAHTPCKRWGNYWSGGPSAQTQRLLGDDGACFAAALHSVRLWGGVLEHPAGSRAWRWHGLLTPLRAGGWSLADQFGWTCQVDQGHYGHRARKPTWLYAVRCQLPSLTWGPSRARVALEKLPKSERMPTPRAFADVLVAMAESVARAEAA